MTAKDEAPHRPRQDADGSWIVEYVKAGETHIARYGTKEAAEQDYSTLLQIFRNNDGTY